ncbi:MAG: entry exclusion lipoprotein TrbK [Gammaproteobacteria bacterium]|nr:entry exclusion lipoprotein TrbK [Gammaproteobacteria bacterium]
MNLKYTFCILGLSAVLVGCSAGGLPEANTVNCAGRGMELALQEFNERGTEAERQAFVDGCNALANK